MVGATRIELAFTPRDVPPVHKRSLIISKTEFKRMVGATRIELATSRPPDVRATTAPSPELILNIWSGRPDLNWRPRSPEPRALPTAPRPDIFILSRKPQTLLKSNYGIQ